MKGILFVLFYALLSAYITGASDLLCARNPSWSPPWVSVCVVFVFGGLVGSQMHWLDLSNRILFALKALVFGGLMGVFVWHVDPGIPYWTSSVSTRAWRHAVPIFFTSFGFHGSIAAVMGYVPLRATKTAFLFGSLIPLAMYIAWIILTVGVLAGEPMPSDVGLLVQQLETRLDTPLLGLGVALFSLCAILTSFLGVGLGLLETWQETYPRRTSWLLTFLPPLAFSLFYPRGFLLALTYAALALCLLAVLVPVGLALWMRHIPIPRSYEAPGGRVGLVCAWALGLLLFGLEGSLLWFS